MPAGRPGTASPIGSAAAASGGARNASGADASCLSTGSQHTPRPSGSERTVVDRQQAGVHLARPRLAGTAGTQLKLGSAHCAQVDVPLVAGLSPWVRRKATPAGRARTTSVAASGVRRGAKLDGSAALRGAMHGLHLLSRTRCAAAQPLRWILPVQARQSCIAPPHAA